ncbi:Pyrophosphate--fructose 6-phosphate 1-phosphotransferase subunit alpha [Dichanthelium oligosanthes]|uniref:Pyrophosphate--fructose 6-phosphate 1-phosphotransferase subunit alpha n=1 Tax=Dichanthelium oligosanthes TaxID=888268 RepID=A0A1E5WBX7_9POAL|nr:Pyrophosphate--fructose 6-phosphate 1-phosphotransferase subunit alpha [Dichanthelium oligosanthes]
MDSDYGVPRELSEVQKKRALYQPEVPPCLQGTTVRVEYGGAAIAADPAGAHVISQAFPHTYGQPLAHFLRKTAVVPDAKVISEHPAVRVGIVFCGRQSPGGHNVVWGLYEAIKAHNQNSKLIGFLGGSDGLLAQKTLEITDEVLSSYKNQGGYDMLGRTKDQIRTTEQVNGAMASCQALKLDALVIIGGVTSNTDAAQLAETFAEAKCATKVVGVPVTLNGDLKNQFVETTVGFDTICKVNSQLISNVCTDALSAEKVILGEEVAASKLTIFDITKQICDAVQARAEKDKNHGVVLIPEGLVESVSAENISSQLSPWASALFEFLPPFIRKQLLLHPESDDSAQLSQIETEKLLAQLVETEMNRRLVLGHVCYHIIAAGLNGYMATVTNLKSPVNKWRCGAAPISSMMTVKRWSRGPSATQIGKPAVHMASVDLKGKAYELLRQSSSSFMLEDIYRNPGPLQFEGPGADSKPISLCVEDQDYMGRIKKLQEYLEKVKSIVKPGCSQDVLKAALSAMSSVTETLNIMTSSSTGQTPL